MTPEKTDTLSAPSLVSEGELYPGNIQKYPGPSSRPQCWEISGTTVQVITRKLGKWLDDLKRQTNRCKLYYLEEKVLNLKTIVESKYKHLRES